MEKVSMRRIVKTGGEWLALAAIFCIAFVLRYHFLTAYPHALMLHEQDGISYMAIAKGIIEGKPLQSTIKPPFYPFVVAIFARLPVDLEFAARLASIIMDALIVFPLYGLARAALSRPTSLVAATLWAFFSFSLFFSPSPLSLSTYLFFLLAGTCLLYLCLEKDWHSGWLSLSGALFAFSYLARPEGIVAFACGAALLLICPVLGGELGKRRAVRLPLFLGGFLLFAVPYMVFLRNHLGYWTVTGKTEAALKGVDGAMTLQGSNLASFKGSGFSLWLEQYGGVAGFLANTLKNFKGFMEIFFATFPLWMFVIALVGVFYFLSEKGLREKLYLLVPLLATMPVYVAKVSHTNSYIYPFYPVFFILFVAGIVGILKGGLKLVGVAGISVAERVTVYATALLLLFSTGFVAFASFEKADANFNSQEFVFESIRSNFYRDLGYYINSISNKDDMVMTRWSVIPYYADRPVIGLPKGSIADVLAYGRKNGARFLVIDTASVKSRRQELGELLKPLAGLAMNPSYGLRVVRAETLSIFGGYVLYELVK